MTQKHTPGPWQYSSTGPTMLGYSQPYAVAQEGVPNLICGCFDDVNGGIDTAQANARLIAAAPDLYAALYELLKEYDISNRLGDDDTDFGTLPPVVKAKAALEKAGAA